MLQAVVRAAERAALFLGPSCSGGHRLEGGDAGASRTHGLGRNFDEAAVLGLAHWEAGLVYVSFIFA